MGELGRAKIAIQRLLYTDDEYVLAHAAEVVEVNNFCSVSFLFCCRYSDLAIFCFCNLSIYFHGKYLIFFPQIVHFSNFFLIFPTIPFSFSEADKGIL